MNKNVALVDEDTLAIIEWFSTAEEAVEFISNLPNQEDVARGRYGIDVPEESDNNEKHQVLSDEELEPFVTRAWDVACSAHQWGDGWSDAVARIRREMRGVEAAVLEKDQSWKAAALHQSEAASRFNNENNELRTTHLRERLEWAAINNRQCDEIAKLRDKLDSGCEGCQ